MSLLVLLVSLPSLNAQTIDVSKKLQGFDQYMEKVLKDWNEPGAGVGVVIKNKLVFAKGYGYRDYGQKLPVTPKTLFQIASNTKLFTAVAVGMLVEDGKLDWDKPIRNYVPSIQFYDKDLNNSVTIRDMLSHRTGISRHDLIWYKSDFTRKELFEKLKYLEPSQPLRQGYLYNNLMYVSAGYIIEVLSNQTWESYVQNKILNPLGMSSTVFTVDEMKKQPDHGVPYNEKRDTTILYQIPIYEDQQAVGPAGCIISNIEDMSKWLIALMNNGNYQGKAVISPKIIKATLSPSIALPNRAIENKGYKEVINNVYGMGRFTASYRGHLYLDHGGALPGFFSQFSIMPLDSIGVIVFVIGDQGSVLNDVITYNLYERFLGMDQTPWNERLLKEHKEGQKFGKEGRTKVGGDRIIGTKPSHPLSDFVAQYENPAYGIINITMVDTSLQLDYNHMVLPLKHYHYDRFDSPNHEEYGLWSINFFTNPQGVIDKLTTSLDESQVSFTRKADASLSDPKILSNYVGKYEKAGVVFSVELVGKELFLMVPGQPSYQITPVKAHSFKIKNFADYSIVFIVENGEVKAIKQIDPSGEYRFERKK